MSEGKTRCIVGAAAGLLWGATLATAHIDLNLRLYLAVWMATGIATLTAVAWSFGMKFQEAQAQRDAATRATIYQAVERLEQATYEHGSRVEAATERHGDHLAEVAFRADRWFNNGMKAAKIAGADAVVDVARSNGEDPGQLHIINGHG